MTFSEVLGQQHIKSHLAKTVKSGKIPHTQLFIGKSGSGLLALALSYANEILCQSYDEKSDAYTSCKNKVNKLAHPDLHFVYPVNTNEDVKKNPISDNFASSWRDFVLNNSYSSLYDWYQFIGIEKKQGNISKHEAVSISKKLSLKSYEGGYKVLIIWMAEKMNNECANQLLKLIEEPPEKTVVLLLTENVEIILDTIKSRCQKLHIPSLAEEEIYQELVDAYSLKSSEAKKISHQSNGDFNKALQIIKEDNKDVLFEDLFVLWVRTAFKAKKNKEAVNGLFHWSEKIAEEGRETQKRFLNFCLEIFRQAMLKNYNAESLIYFQSHDGNFSFDKFSAYIHQNNILDIREALEKAIYHIERNGNAKIIFTDVSIQLTRLIHRNRS
ncbi:MAG: DNA polymerase III subunit delta' [Flavobacteriaceae bacterium]|nr:DNA polymerase III subunit delta' [Flavobacteriaceae bacterium]MDG2446428.1 DNA polymerase III subunit delta' [Flavobacteriaceae bacterium]